MQQFEDETRSRNGDRTSSASDELAGIVASHWLEILGTAPSEQPDFSRAGGTSVDLVELQLRLLRDDSIALELGGLPDPLTYDALVRAVAQAPDRRGRRDGSAESSIDVDIPMEGAASSAQIEQWIAEKIQPESSEYLVPIRVELPEGTTWASLDAAIIAVVNAHPSLRTSIHSRGGQEGSNFIQRVHPPIRSSGVLSRPAWIVEEDLPALLRERSVVTPTVESERKWLAIGLVEDGRIHSVLLLFHHVAVDDHSLNLIVRDLGCALEKRNLSEEELSVIDWTAMSTVDLKESLGWWRQRLAGVPTELNLDSALFGHVPSSQSEEIVGRIDREIVSAIDDRLREQGVMRSAAAIGILRDVLFDLELAGDDRIAIGTPMSLRDHPSVFGTTGMFLNTVPVVMDRTTDLVEVGRDLWETKRHRRAPYLGIVEAVAPVRSSDRSAWLDACIGIMESSDASTLPWELLATGETAFPILLMARWTDEGLTINCQVQCRFGGSDLAGRIVKEYTRRLEELSGDRGWQPPAPSRLGGPRREALGETVIDVVSRQATAIPDAIAIHDARTNASVDYRQLEILSGRIAATLVGEGMAPGTPVAILFDHGPELAIATLGVMKAGGIAMPLPANTPSSRLNQLLELAGSENIVGGMETLEAVELKRLHGSAVDYAAATAADPDASAQVSLVAADAAYLLFTSGSTGEPKPVVMSHEALANLVRFEVERSPREGSGRCAQFAAVGFDVSLQEIFSTWARGETLHPIPSDLRRDPAELVEFLDRHEISRIYLPPLMARAIANTTRPVPPSIEEIVCAGEALRIDDALRAEGRRSSFRIVNQYGPTETHVVTSLDLGSDPDEWPSLPDIGEPIDGVTVRIEDASGDLVDQGRSGEIVIEGVAVGIGYRGEDQGGFDRRSGIARYRTGDMGRVLPNGRVEFLGRRDAQVKIAGYRVEPAEVEAAITGLPGVEDSGVVAVTDGSDSKLHAFIEGEQAVTEDVTIRRLREVLPHWMVPSSVVRLAKLPKTASGKVDRGALRRIAIATGRGGTSRKKTFADAGLTELCSRMPTMSSLDLAPGRPLSESGVDSLLAIRIQSTLDRDFDAFVPVREILAATPADILQVTSGVSVDQRQGSTEAGPRDSTGSMPSIDQREWRPLNPLVRDVLAKDAMSSSGVFHLAWSIQDPRPFDADGFKKRLASLKARWPNLRSRWSATSGTRVSPFDPMGEIDLTVYGARPSEEIRQQFLHHRIDLELVDPIRVAVWPEADGGHAALFVIHHVAVDGVLAREMIDEFLDQGPGEGIPVERTTIDPSTELLDLDGDLGWWKSQLETNLGGDGLPVPENRTGADAEQVYAVFEDADLKEIVEQAGRHLPHGRVACALAAWAVLLGHRLCRDRVVIGVPFAMDSRQGLAANMLPIVIDIAGVTVEEILESISRQIANGIEHRRASFGSILNAMASEHDHLRPPVDGVLTIDDLVRTHESGASVRWEPVRYSSFQASAVLPQSAACSHFGLEGERGFLDGESVDSMLSRWMHIMRRLAESSLSIDRGDAIESIETLTPSMRRELEAFGGCESVRASEGSVLERFDRMLEARREAIAITDGTESISYGELDGWSRAIADQLVAHGVKQGDPVAIASIRRISTAAGLLGVLRAGGWFVPIEKDVPRSKRSRQVEACGCVVGLEAPDDDCLPSKISAVVNPEACREVASTASSHEGRIVDGDSPMYGMFTSGTTGEPRCVVVPHRAVLRLVDDPFFLRLDERSRVLNAAPLAFDASTIEIWGALLNGGTVATWTGHSADLAGIADFVMKTEVDTCWLTTALFNAAVDSLPRFFRSISTVMTGGDVVSVDHVRRIMSEHPGLMVVNGYGPTENTVFTSCEVVPPGGSPIGDFVPIGRPIRGTPVRIVDDAGRLVPRGRFGQLVVEGQGLALGYLGCDGKPEASGGFRSSDDSSVCRYHTGDYARWTSSGSLQFGGRRDHQVKVAGHRIELIAIDHALRSLPMVADACSCVVKHDGRTVLAAVVVPSDDRDLDEDEILAEVGQLLLRWEIPSRIVSLDKVPVTANGKPDRAAIADRILASFEVGVVASDSGPGDLADAVRQTVEKMVVPRQVDSSRSLRHQGMDSLDMLRLAIELEKVLGRPIHLSDILTDSSVDSIAKCIAEDLHREADPVVTLHAGTPHCRTGVFCIPGVGGTVFSFERILDGLPSWCPVHGLPYPGISGEREPESRVENLADVLADSSGGRIPRNPILVGYSFGGFVAFEFARRLLARGHRPVVVAIDAAPVSLEMYRGRAGSLRNWKLKLANVLPKSLANRVGVKKSFAVRHLRAVVAASFEAIRHYTPEPLDVPVHLLRTRETDFAPFDEIEDLGWRELTPRVTVDYLPGDHLEVFRVASMEVAQQIREITSRGRRDS